MLGQFILLVPALISLAWRNLFLWLWYVAMYRSF